MLVLVTRIISKFVSRYAIGTIARPRLVIEWFGARSFSFPPDSKVIREIVGESRGDLERRRAPNFKISRLSVLLLISNKKKETHFAVTRKDKKCNLGAISETLFAGRYN